MKTKEELIQNACLVRDAQYENENTALRIGTLFLDLILSDEEWHNKFTELLEKKQPMLVSGKSIATINGRNLLLGGNIEIKGGGGGTGGAVNKVNGQTGDVMLSAGDIPTSTKDTVEGALFDLHNTINNYNVSSGMHGGRNFASLSEALSLLSGLIEDAQEINTGLILTFKNSSGKAVNYIYQGPRANQSAFTTPSNWEEFGKGGGGGSVSTDTILDTVCDSPITEIQLLGTAWNITNKSGQEIYYPNADARLSGNNITIEKGWTLKYSGQWKWVAREGKKNPTRTDGSWGTALPAPGVLSSALTKEGIKSNTTIKQNIYAAKNGVVVKGDKLVRSSGAGEDVASVQATATFLDRYYYGTTEVAKPTGPDVTKLASKDLTTTRARKVQHVTITGNQRFCYAYPYSLGALTSAIVGGLDFLSDFDRQDNVTVTNTAGEQIRYYVYTFKNLGAFNDSTIDFK